MLTNSNTTTVALYIVDVASLEQERSCNFRAGRLTENASLMLSIYADKETSSRTHSCGVHTVCTLSSVLTSDQNKVERYENKPLKGTRRQTDRYVIRSFVHTL